ncbi:MAG: phosphoribosyltransferase family protein [Eubacteriales bacterium]|nr:adenine phosphoribosyltransferase [Eubacteriales bacterium]MCI6971552.1 adenine phosphoribosyltransferase [Eubacterium sp.]MDD7573890.1 phosphoribosyltransferase family protein [Eubacteriales bacterium]MDY5355872.1 phosphoribosyltransferase family protein [Eubacteriales bacterium]
MYYEIEIAGLKRKLPLCPITDSLYIGAFIMFGDVEITRAAATELLKIAPEHDIMITAESKGIPLVYEMARQSNAENYLLARKTPKLYMRNIFSVEVKSITHATVQTLYLDGDDAEAMRGKRVLIVDDVVSTGESLRALETLVTKAGGIIAGKMCVLAEGDAANRDDIKYLSVLPVFNADGTIKE